ncbi:MAG: hypothetical protein JKY20_10700 [Alphaproteobacteria bacterium]|nr:hypothetical protein [Alphaproteobacteria bacterium]
MADVAGVSAFSTSGIQGFTPASTNTDGLDDDRAAEEQAIAQLETEDATGGTDLASAVTQTGQTPLNADDGGTGGGTTATTETTTATAQTQDSVQLSAEGTVAAQAAVSATTTSENGPGATAVEDTGNSAGNNQTEAAQTLGQVVDVFA